MVYNGLKWSKTVSSKHGLKTILKPSKNRLKTVKKWFKHGLKIVLKMVYNGLKTGWKRPESDPKTVLIQ